MMKAFHANDDGTLSAELDGEEAHLIQTLAAQIRELVRNAPESTAGDPALARLFPAAYSDDAEASAEFRRYTAADLVDRKVHNAMVVHDTIERGLPTGGVTLSPEETVAWLKTINDIRLTLAARLGIDDSAGTTVDPVLRDLYDWLGFVQNSLLEVLDG